MAYKGYEDFVVQDLQIRPLAPVTTANAGGIPTTNWWPTARRCPTREPLQMTLISFIIYLIHYRHLTHPLLLQQLDHRGIDISAGQLNGILTEKKDVFHDEKTEVLLAGLEVSSSCRWTTAEAGTRRTTASVPISATSCSPISRAPTAIVSRISFRCSLDPIPITLSTTQQCPIGSGKNWPRR